MAERDAVAETNKKLFALRDQMTAQADNPRLIALTNCLIDLTTDPNVGSQPAELEANPAPVQTTAARFVRPQVSDAVGTCTHPRVVNGLCGFCGEAV